MMFLSFPLLLFASVHIKNGAAETMPVGVTTEKVKEVESISSYKFVDEHLSLLDETPNPLIIRSAARKWPAITEWTDEYLIEKYGKLQLKLDQVKNKSKDRPPQGNVCLGRDTLEHFLKTYREEGNKKFVDSELPMPLYSYVQIPPPLACDGVKDSLVEVDLLISSGSHQTLLRKDLLNSFTCVLNGSVDWKLVEPSNEEYMYEIQKGDSTEVANIRYSHVNIKDVNFKKYPMIKQVPKVLTAELHPGDCLYVPAGYWHTEVAKSEKNMDVKFIMRETKDINFTNVETCVDETKTLGLTEVDPDWQYKGKGLMTKGFAPFAYYMELIDRFFLLRSNLLKYENVYMVLSHIASYLPYGELQVNDNAVDLYGRLTDVAGNLEFTSDNIMPLIKREEWREIIKEYIQPFIPSNTYDHEYVYYSADQMLSIFSDISEQNNGLVEKTKFIDAYVALGGHEKIAKKVWKKIDEEAKEIDFESSASDIERGLDKNYLYYQEELSFNEEEMFEDYGDIPVKEEVAPKDEL